MVIMLRRRSNQIADYTSYLYDYDAGFNDDEYMADFEDELV